MHLKYHGVGSGQRSLVLRQRLQALPLRSDDGQQ